MSFLKAEWKNLAIINYEVDPSILAGYLPQGTKIDYWNEKCYVSLVGFLFKNTRVLGLKIPFHIDFEEVNLRFYVKRFENGQWKRGVVFIKEIVPKTAITFVANTFYKENYTTLPMKHSVIKKEDSVAFEYQWKINQKWNSITIETKPHLIAIEENSEAEFITEHYFGYTKLKNNTSCEYEVRHPRWEQFEVIAHSIDVDFESVYGKYFSFLKELKPASVFLAAGSTISVENKRKIKS